MARSKRVTQAQNKQVFEVPRLPEQTITVRARNGAIVYTMEGTRIPEDEWATVPLSPGMIVAIRAGDLEQGTAEPAPRHHHHRRTEHTS